MVDAQVSFGAQAALIAATAATALCHDSHMLPLVRLSGKWVHHVLRISGDLQINQWPYEALVTVGLPPCVVGGGG